jgi:HTH-type transcriptional regulator/antitoxin MqsA
MATKDAPLPETMISPETGETLTRGVRLFTVAYKGESVVVDLPGYYPSGEGEGVHIGKDMAVVDQALRDLKGKADGVQSPETIRRLRTKLQLSSGRRALCSRSGKMSSTNMSGAWSSRAARRSS